MKKLTACLSAVLLLGLLTGPAAFAAPPTTEAPVASPTEPDRPTLPDPNDPDSPDEITIIEDGVPKTYIKVWDPDTEEYVYILDEDPPLSAPQTGVTGISDTAALSLAAAALGVGGVAALVKGKRSAR